jgi:hypothetical protein
MEDIHFPADWTPQRGRGGPASKYFLSQSQLDKVLAGDCIEAVGARQTAANAHVACEGAALTTRTSSRVGGARRVCGGCPTGATNV